MNRVAVRLDEYLHNVQYRPARAKLEVSELPEDFKQFGRDLTHFADNVLETQSFAQELSQGNLSCEIPSHDNELAAPLKALCASLKHLTRQIVQAARGDYRQHIVLPGDFASALGEMIQEIAQRSILEDKERTWLVQYLSLILDSIPDMLLVLDNDCKVSLVNRAFLNGSPYKSAGEVRSRALREIFAYVPSDEFISDCYELLRRAALDKCPYDIERGAEINPGGTEQNYQIRATPMLYEGDVVSGAILLLRSVQQS